jgi:hypothetical protein
VSVSDFDAAAVSTNMKKVMRACVTASLTPFKLAKKSGGGASISRSAAGTQTSITPKSEDHASKPSEGESSAAARSPAGKPKPATAVTTRKRRAAPPIPRDSVDTPSVSKYFKKTPGPE